MQLSAREVAIGKWPGILAELGLDKAFLTGKHCSCPSCGGVDRFRFDDKGGTGSSFCSHCGASDGFGLLMKVKGIDFQTAAKEVERVAGVVKKVAIRAGKTDAEKAKALRRLWLESKPVTHGDPVCHYLNERGISSPDSKALRYHPDLLYSEGGESGRYPAMLALVSSPNGAGASIHRTYLKDGSKAPVSKPKKMMTGLPISGAAVRLFPVAPVLGIAEGIETALMAAQRFAIPVWSAVSAQGMESWVCPEGVEEVVIFGDNDKSWTGQKAAYVLAYKLHEKGIHVRVEIPGHTFDESMMGVDWADLK